MGDEALSLDLLEEAIDQNHDYRHLVATNPDLVKLADHARFQAIIASHPKGR